MSDLSWMDYGACGETGGDIHFPAKGESVRDAKKVCAGCFVRQECGEHALANPGLTGFGIWGGMSLHERRRARQNRSAA